MWTVCYDIIFGGRYPILLYDYAGNIYKTQKVSLYTHAHVRSIKHSSLFTVHNGRRHIVYIIIYIYIIRLHALRAC